ncbi:MAG: cytochrome b/b6 domain-containing protein [Aurantimonas coralicida]|jgi:cytochrome b561/polyisoprenoid-binding protein YceI|uniref:cytochrome b/b6 domain-containing protein n=1 Tax=Aurantimonas TaxID=182269 RepID=UPI000414A103|nr:cytochrome b/b6 domain-containing protein [Aurantimonas coralicida]
MSVSPTAGWSAAYTRYTSGAILLHWTIALAILFQLAVGLAMVHLDAMPDALRFALFQWHKTIGILVLCLTLARIAWRLVNPPPALAPTTTRAERAASGLVHLAFYALMLIVPLSGWLLVSAAAAGIPTYLFLIDSLEWPHLPVAALVPGMDAAALEDVFGFAHKWLALSFLGLLVLHVAGALKHSLVDAVPSFSRMLPHHGMARPQTRLIAIPIALAVVLSALGGGLVAGQSDALLEAGATRADRATAAPDAGPAGGDWIVDPAQSRLGFETQFSGKTLTGTIGAWQADVRFSPEALDLAEASITIDAASIDVDNSFVAPQVQSTDGFASETHPTVTLQLSDFRALETGYEAGGTLTIKEKSLPVTVPFRFEQDGDGTAHVVGSATVDRTAFDLGVANDPTGQYLDRAVTIRFELVAVPAGATDPGS